MKRSHFAYFVLFFMSSISLKNVICDGELLSKQDGKLNIKIAVILPLSEEKAEFKCSDRFYPDTLQNVEALYYALDLIENDDTLLRNITLNVDVIENCNSPMLAMRHLSNLVEQLQVKSIYDDNATFGLIYTNDLVRFKYETVFELFPNFPRISYEGPPKEIIDVNDIKEDSTSFFITLTSGHIFIADVIFEILKHYDWRYITIFDPPPCGHNDVKNFFIRRAEELARSDGVCIDHSTDALCEANERYRLEIDFIPPNNTVDVIICYCNQYEILGLKEELEKYNKKYVVIAGYIKEYWTDEEPVEWTSNVGDLYYVTPAPQQDEKFHHYYTSLSIRNNTRHHFLEKFRERYFKAQFNSEIGNEEIIADTEAIYRDTYKNNSKTSFNIIKSLYIMAFVLDDAHKRKGTRNRVSAGSKLRQVNFKLVDEEVSFTRLRGLLKAERFNIHKFQEQKHESGRLVKVGEYMKYGDTDDDLDWEIKSSLRIRGKLTMMDAASQYSKDFPKQICSKLCPARHAKIIYQYNQCCWECVECNHFEKLSSNATSCINCEDGSVANQNRTECTPIADILHLPIEWTDYQNLISIGFSLISIVLTVIVSCVFVKYQDTPAVKSTTRELCYVMFAGIILVNITLFISTVTLSFGTSDMKVLPAMGFTMIYSALLVKTNRIARILVTSKHKFANVNPKYVSLKAQITITSILIGIETLVCWFAVKLHYPDSNAEGNDFILRQYYLDEAFFVQIFAFVAILILLCTYYAFKTRTLPENFNETKCIGFAMYATVITAIAFSLVYFATEKKILAMNLCASINSLTILVFLFSPKLYIILWTPEKNTRVYFSPVSSNIRSYMGNESRPNASAPSNQSFLLENSGPQPSLNNTAEELKEQVRDSITKVMKELDNIPGRELNLGTLKEKIKKGDLEPDEMENTLKKAYSEIIEKCKVQCQVELNRIQKKVK
ncbi:metabotropic glutamate receptor 1-like [Planococcus citri]|uniref:metabotropic glutamate receptor 1-like n=1 Tax=Planococcus citri TaxID=170843 RepID=UPI0031F85A45